MHTWKDWIAITRWPIGKIYKRCHGHNNFDQLHSNFLSPLPLPGIESLKNVEEKIKNDVVFKFEMMDYLYCSSILNNFRF